MKKLIDRLSIGSLLTVFILISCDKQQIEIDDIKFKTDANFEISIEGFISTELTIHTLKIFEPSYGYGSLILIPVNNANVYLSTKNKLYKYKKSVQDGFYESEDSIKGEIGKIYTINILLKDKHYTATDKMTRVDDIIDIPIRDVEYYEDHVEVGFMEHNFGYNVPSIWTFTESTDSIGNIISYDKKDFYNILLFNHKGSIPQGIFPSGFLSTGASGLFNDSLEIIKMSVSDNYYNYLVSLFNITDWSSGIFSTILGNTKTNVSEGGTGFFYATDIVRHRLTYNELVEYE